MRESRFTVRRFEQPPRGGVWGDLRKKGARERGRSAEIRERFTIPLAAREPGRLRRVLDALGSATRSGWTNGRG
jgi:hypothetical protein